jgi:hypothetical protein
VTNPQQHDDDQGDVLQIRERVETRERLVSRTCGWCGIEIPYSGSGRPRRFCRDSHRKRANEAARAGLRAEAAAARGERTTEPVREVVERTETTVRTVVRRGPTEVRHIPATRRSGEPFTLPETPQEWYDTLKYLAGDIAAGRIPEQWHSHFRTAFEELGRRVGGPPQAVPAAIPQQSQLSRAERRRQAREDRRRGRYGAALSSRTKPGSLVVPVVWSTSIMRNGARFDAHQRW